MGVKASKMINPLTKRDTYEVRIKISIISIN
jgi:hypothetical protein